MSKRKKLPKGWRWEKLGKVCDSIGGGTPSRKIEAYFKGEVPWLTVKDLQEGEYEIDDSSEHITEEAIAQSSTNLISPNSVIVATRVGLGKVAVNSRPVAINQDLRALLPHNGLHPEYLAFAIFDTFFSILKYKQGTTVKGITKDDFLSIKIPLPPLAVQERIVEILQQADAIRRKRAEARRLADQILPALFLDMFGDPATNPKGWPVESFGQVLKDETRKAGKLPIADYKAQGEFPIIDQGEEFIAGYTDRADCVFSGELPVILFGDHTRRFKYVDFPFVLGADGVKILKPLKGVPAFIYQQLRASLIPNRGYERHFKYVKELSFVLPPKQLQEWLADCFAQYYESEKRTASAYLEAEQLFQSVLSRAFTGELTEEWEAENADWIAERQAFYERLPRLALLTLLQERHERVGRNAETLITALMKYVFLTQMEGSLHRRLYRFVPYHYGPCAMELYGDLEALANDGLIIIESDAEEDKTRIKLADPDRAAALLEEEAHKDESRLAAIDQSDDEAEAVTDPVMPRLLRRRAEILETLRTDSTTVLDTYGDLDHNALLKTVYEKYPAYAKKSRVRKTTRVKSGKKTGLANERENIL